jgi:hypothetical protein
MARRNRLLELAAAADVAVVLVHIAAIAIGGSAYRYLGAARYAMMAEAGSTMPAIVTGAVTVVFLLFGLFALAGAGRIRPLPLMRPMLLGIGGLYALRGLVLIADIIGLIRGAGYPVRQAVFSALSLATGLFHIGGAMAMDEGEP